MAVLTAARPRLRSRWHAFESWVGTRSSAAALLVVALAVYALESAIVPAYPGRDMTRYLQAFVQLGYDVPVYPAVLNTRGPLAAVGVALPLEVGGWAAEVFLALLYALSIVAWARVALVFGARAAALTSVLLLVYPGYGILFHQLASDSLFAAAFAGWAVLVARALVAPAIPSFLAAGVGLGSLVLVRPANQALLVMAALPLFARAEWRARVSWAAAMFVPAVVVAQIWRAYAQWRWADAVTLKVSAGLLAAAVVLVPLLVPRAWRARAAVAVALLVVVGLAVRGSPDESPRAYVRSVATNTSNQFLYRSFELARIMSPDNGPASRRVAAVVQRDLLTREPYRSYGVDVHEFFASGSDRVFGDLTGVVNGNDLAAATREAIRRHPGTFTSSIARTAWEQLARRPVYAPEPAESDAAAPASRPRSTPYVNVHGRRLPKPSEGQPIPGSAIGPMLWTPGGEAHEVWVSPTEHHYVFSNPRDERRAAKFDRAVGRLDNRIPTRNENAPLVHRLNQAAHAFPPMVVWLVVGLIAIAFRRPQRAVVAIAPAVAGLVVIVVSSLVAPSVAEYGAPVSPAFVLLATAGVFGVPARRWELEGSEWRRRVEPWSPYVAAAIAIAAAAWAAKTYATSFWHYVRGGTGGVDLGVFLDAAAKVVHGASPYAFHADRTYAYPPFLGYLMAPLHPLDRSVAAILWMLLSLAAIAVALWLLELRDWRCYALVAVFLVTRSAIDLGTIEPLLLLAIAAAWRWRERVVAPAVAVGFAIVLKLFLWPLVVWLALMRRGRAAVVSVGVAVALAVGSWGGIGFAGLTGYPHLLRRLADAESTSSYSVVALGVRAHLPLVAARVISVLVALALLAAAAWVARSAQLTERDRDVAVLTLALAAALAASPIVWLHYFLLLLVPLALARPRFSPLWLVPFAYQWMGESTWPSGDARRLGVALAATLILLFAGVARATPWSDARSR